MSDKPKYGWNFAHQIACDLERRLAPFCERVTVAGSLRRGIGEVGDIELLFVPKTEMRPDGLFEQTSHSLADGEIDRLLRMGILSKRQNVNGSEIWGPKNKLARHVASGIPVDLFATTDEKWWVSLVIRTGSKETNLRLTTGAQKKNCSLEAYGSGVRNRATAELTQAVSERHVFELCGVPYLEPYER